MSTRALGWIVSICETLTAFPAVMRGARLCSRFVHDMTSKKRLERAGSIESMAPDVACLEEAGAYRWLDDANQRPDAFKAAMKGWHFASRGEILIATKLEIVAEHIESLAPGPAARPLVDAVLKIGGQ